MLILMCCTLYATALYFFLNDIIFYNVIPETYCSPPSYGFNLLINIISVLPSFFLGVGAMLNLNKWIYFYLRIKAFVIVGEGLYQLDSLDKIGNTTLH